MNLRFPNTANRLGVRLGLLWFAHQDPPSLAAHTIGDCHSPLSRPIVASKPRKQTPGALFTASLHFCEVNNLPHRAPSQFVRSAPADLLTRILADPRIAI